MEDVENSHCFIYQFVIEKKTFGFGQKQIFENGDQKMTKA